MSSTNLFEFQEPQPFEERFNIEKFESFLDKIWEKRGKSLWWGTTEEEELKEETQQFLTINHEKKYLRARNYVGYIRYGDYEFHLLPKIFSGKNNIKFINRHVLWWLSYSRRLRAPRLDADFNRIKCDNFLQVLIYLFATHTREQLSRKIYQTYTEKSDEVSFIKGKLNTSAYIEKNVITGRWMHFYCDYDVFEIDNKFNRAIKYTCRLLLPAAGDDTKKILREILFLLDEVKDVQVRIEDLNKIKLHNYYADMQPILDYCKLFISHSTIHTFSNKLHLFAFLVPMEKVFEEFVCGFLERHKGCIGLINIQAQSKTKLDEEGKYDIKPDLEITLNNEQKIIADSKYKIIYHQNGRGPSQNDLYQMVTYAIRRNRKKIYLFYPGRNEENPPPDRNENNPPQTCIYNINDVLRNETEEDRTINIEIKVYHLPIINCKDKNFNYVEIEKALIKKFKEIF